MVEDGTAGNFFSALEAFESRSCYANSSGTRMTRSEIVLRPTLGLEPCIALLHDHKCQT